MPEQPHLRRANELRRLARKVLEDARVNAREMRDLADCVERAERKTAEEKSSRAERNRLAYAMRCEGMAFTKIGEAIGVGTVHARTICHREWAKAGRPDVDAFQYGFYGAGEHRKEGATQ